MTTVSFLISIPDMNLFLLLDPSSSFCDGVSIIIYGIILCDAESRVLRKATDSSNDVYDY